MAGPTLDGAGTAKMVTLDEAATQLQHLHSIVERMALEVKNNKPVAGMVPQLKRAGTPMIGLLKAQFGLMSDQVAAMLLAATRGGGDQAKIRTLREGVGSLRQQLEIAVNRVKAQHGHKDEKKDAPVARDA